MWRWGSHDRLKIDQYGRRVAAPAEKKAKKANIVKYNREQSKRRLKFDRLCNKYGLKARTVKCRMQRRKDGTPGMTLRQALRVPYRQKSKPGKNQRKWNRDAWKEDK